MIDLSNVTLWSCVWSHGIKLLNRTVQVMCYCQTLCKFGDVILFTSSDLDCDCENWKVIQVFGLNAKKWSQFVNFEVPKHVKSSYAMSVHEDGFILNPDLWTNDFLSYDYIGAPWPDHIVGNGGFNIESRRLLEEKLKLPMNNDPSDVFVCRTHRKALENKGIKFAPEDLALRFSTEQTCQDQLSFGFHGRTATPNKYQQGWNLINNA